MKELESLTVEELEKLLAEKKKEEKTDYLKKKAEYEKYRDNMVKSLTSEAEELNKKMQTFKDKVMKKMQGFKTKAEEYGDIRKHSQGGYSLRTTDQALKMAYERNSVPDYDERANMAEELLNEFLSDMVKKADHQAYNVIRTLMSRNKKGDFSPARINSLLAIKDNYKDERWKKAMQLFEESFSNRLISYSVSFYKKNEETGKDDHINLSFASL